MFVDSQLALLSLMEANGKYFQFDCLAFLRKQSFCGSNVGKIFFHYLFDFEIFEETCQIHQKITRSISMVILNLYLTCFFYHMTSVYSVVHLHSKKMCKFVTVNISSFMK